MVRPAGENKGGGPVGLGSNQSLHFLAGSVVKEDLGGGQGEVGACSSYLPVKTS